MCDGQLEVNGVIFVKDTHSNGFQSIFREIFLILFFELFFEIDWTKIFQNNDFQSVKVPILIIQSTNLRLCVKRNLVGL